MNTRWIGGRSYDLRWFIGSLFVPVATYGLLLYATDGGPVAGSAAAAIFYFIFTAIFDAPHIFQTVARTHFDGDEWRRSRRFHLAALPLALLISVLATVSGEGGTLALGLYFYGSWHIARQNLGFIKLYQKLNAGCEHRARRIDHIFAMLLLFYFFVHEDNGIAAVTSLTGPRPWLIPQLQLGTAALLLLALAVWAGKELQFWIRSRRINMPKVLFLLGNAALFIGLTKVHVDLLTMTALATIAHDIQYQAWMWLYHGAKGRGPVSRAQWLAVCVAGGIFAAFPFEKIGLDAGGVDLIGPLYAGLVLWHYFIDGKIWKFSVMPELRAMFGGAQA